MEAFWNVCVPCPRVIFQNVEENVYQELSVMGPRLFCKETSWKLGFSSPAPSLCLIGKHPQVCGICGLLPGPDPFRERKEEPLISARGDMDHAAWLPAQNLVEEGATTAPAARTSPPGCPRRPAVPSCCFLVPCAHRPSSASLQLSAFCFPPARGRDVFGAELCPPKFTSSSPNL